MLIDAETGQVLFDKNMNRERHPASITKIMTGLLAVELTAPDEIAEVSEEAVDFPYEVSHIALTPGEVIPVDSLMYALMLESANDAANVLAEHIDGTQAAFARRMTGRAKEIGAANTSFSNPHGLDEPFHLTTAYDMALITREAIKNEEFMKYFSAQRHTIPPTNKQPKARPFVNGQHMLLPDQHLAYNEDVIGGKVGYTDEAKHTMVTAAERNRRTLIAVVMGCGYDERYYDTEALLDYGFDELEAVELPPSAFSELPETALTRDGARVGEISYQADAPGSLLLPKGMSAADIAYEYLIPDTLEEGDEPSATVRLTLKNAPGGVSAPLLELPLAAAVRADALTEGVPVTAGQTPGLSRDFLPEAVNGSVFAVIFGKWYIALIVIAAIPATLLVMRHVQLVKRRRRRRRRMARILELRK